MKWKNKLLLLSLSLTTLSYYIVKEFSEDKQILFTIKVLGIVPILLFFAKLYYQYALNGRDRQRCNRFIRKYFFIRLVVDIDVPILKMSVDEIRDVKIDILNLTGNKCLDIENGIKDESIFTFDFNLDPGFSPGSNKINKDREWQSKIDEKLYQVILGESGSGKSFELIKRAILFHNHREKVKDSGRSLFSKRIPVFIELKSLSGDLNDQWILDFLTNNGSKDIQFSEGRLESLIKDNHLVYFFDGLDEVSRDFREDCLSAIGELSKKTSVFFTCRREIYIELKAKRNFNRYYPAEYDLKPLDELRMQEIVRNLDDIEVSEQIEILNYIRGKEQLLKHLSVPLIFNLFIKVFHSLSTREKENLLTQELKGLLRLLWEHYEITIEEHKFPGEGNKLKRIRAYTVWIAKILGQETFLVEKIQPKEWLVKLDENGKNPVPSRRLEIPYVLITRVLICVFLGIAVGFIIATPFAFLGNSVLAGTLVALFGEIYKQEIVKIPQPKNSMIKWNWQRTTFVFLFVVVLMLVLGICCAVYQGLSVPRGTEDMQTPIFSIPESYGGIILSFVIATIFSFRFILESEKGQYILPVENFKFNWRQAIVAGIVWGGLFGVVIGVLGLTIKNHFAESSFFSRWLNPYLKQSIEKVKGTLLLGFTDDLILFLFALCVAFSVAFIIVALLAGRYADSEESVGARRKKKDINSGMLASARHAMYHAAWIGVTVALLYGLLLTNLGAESIGSGIRISIGMALISFLWFGGIEVIHHAVLRLKLALMGIAPISYKDWFKYNQDMAIIRGSGTYLSFYHTSLLEYYTNYQILGSDRLSYQVQKNDRGVSYGMLIIALGFFAIPFFSRYVMDTYWHRPSELHITVNGLKAINDSTYVVEKTGKLKVIASGEIFVGTFTGYSQPEGKITGFLGMPLNEAYNRSDALKYRHAAALVRISSDRQKWSEYKYLSPGPRVAKDTSWLYVKKGQRMEFVVNDREWQNNQGHYKLSMLICDTCKVKLSEKH